MNTEEAIPIRFTSAALEEIIRRMDRFAIKNPVLRIGVKNVGAESTEFLLAFDRVEEKDMVYQEGHFTIVINAKDLMFVIGMTIDYAILANQPGFVFRA
jgi:Fe-S cluster assembly iron-binding protein IscA